MLVDWFLENACPDHHVRDRSAYVRAQATAMRMLTRYPHIAEDSFCNDVVAAVWPKSSGSLRPVLRQRRPCAVSACRPMWRWPITLARFTSRRGQRRSRRLNLVVRGADVDCLETT
jgi:hypothetical protein